MTRLIDDLVDAARLESGHLALRLEPTDLGAFLPRGATAWRERSRWTASGSRRPTTCRRCSPTRAGSTRSS